MPVGLILAGGLAVLLWALQAARLIPGGGGGGMGAQSFISAARSRLGWGYSLGAGLPGEKSSPPFTDCGKLITDSLADAGVSGIPRNITGQVNAAPFKLSVQGWTRENLINALRPGDCIAFDWAGGFEGRPYDHGGIWTGSKLLHASSSKGGVVEVDMLGSGWKTVYSWFR